MQRQDVDTWKHMVLSLAVVVGTCTSLRGATLIYVSLDGENRIACYRADAMTGELTRMADTDIPSPAGALAASPDRRLLIASLRPDGRLASFEIAGNDQPLRLCNIVPAGDDPAFVTTDRSGQFVLTAYYVAGKVTIHAIEDDGSLSHEPQQTVMTADKAHAILTDPDNRFAFVPHTGPNAIYCFHFDAQRGRLTPGTPARIDTGADTGPRHLAFHPRLDVVYFDYEQGSAVAAFRLQRSSGTLEFVERVSTLPADYEGENSNARLEMSPDGRFIYAANRGHDSLAMFAIDPQSGKLSSLGQEKTEPTPRGFAIDPSGRFLYAAGQSSGRLAAYRIDPTSGRLTRFATYPVGERPWWVLALDRPEKEN